ncbi:hypothetical protein [Jutongia sp. SJQ-6]
MDKLILRKMDYAKDLLVLYQYMMASMTIMDIGAVEAMKGQSRL